MADIQPTLTARERIAVWSLLLLLKIVKPTSYMHEYKEELDKIREDLLKINQE